MVRHVRPQHGVVGICPATRLLAVSLLATLLTGCGNVPKDSTPANNAKGWSLIAWDLEDFAWMDRDDGGQPDDMVNSNRLHAIGRELSAGHDVLVLRGLGSKAAGVLLTEQLDTNHGLFYIPATHAHQGIAILSNRSWKNPQVHSNLSYRVNGQMRRVVAGSVSVQGVRIWNAMISHPDEAGYEVRRNECRLIAQSIRKELQEGHSIILSVELHDDRSSPMFRSIEQSGLKLLKPLDPQGDCWTCQLADGHRYAMNQTIWVSQDLLNCEHNIADNPDVRTGNCRPQLLRVIRP